MVHVQNNDVFVGAGFQQFHIKQGQRFDVDGLPGAFGHNAFYLFFALIFGQTAQIGQRNVYFKRFVNNLHRLAVFIVESGAQRFVTANDVIQTFFKNIHFKRPDDAVGFGQIVKRAVRLQLLQKPQTLLSKGERQLLIARNGHDGRNFDALTSQL